MDTFDLHIDLGNDAMQNEHDVADTLERLSRRLRQGGADEGKIVDGNGNSVGRYGFDLGLLPLPERGEVREKTDLEHAFDVAAYEAAKAVVNGSPQDARFYAEACAAIGHAINGPHVDHLELNDGDTLIVHCQRPMPREAIVDLELRIRAAVDKDVRVLIFDHGMSLAGVAFAQLPTSGQA